MADLASLIGLAITQAGVVLVAAWRLSSKLTALSERVGELDCNAALSSCISTSTSLAGDTERQLGALYGIAVP